MATKSYTAERYVPTLARTGDAAQGLIYRMKNMLIRGQSPNTYLEVLPDHENLSETIATSTLTGTLSTTSGSKTVTGSGTSFASELHLGQFVLIDSVPGNQLMVVDSIESDTSFTATRAATGTLSGKTGYRLPVLFEMEKKRGTLIRGNAIKFDKGTIVFLGDGTLRVNGSQLGLTTGTWAASRALKIGIRDGTSGNYSVYTLGMPVPTGFTVAQEAASSGTKNMVQGNYSIRFVSARKATKGYNNPSIRYDVTINAASKRVEVTPPAFNSASGNDAWRVYVTRVDDTAGSLAYQKGPWYYFTTITSADISAGKFTLEWLDAEISGAELLSFDNDAPVDAEFIQMISGYPLLISCQGDGNASKDATSPGPFIIPCKRNNVEAAPLLTAAPLSPNENIIGAVSAQGRVYLMTPNCLQMAFLTGLDSAPVSTRPFWKAGFKNPYSLIFVNGTLFGFTESGPTRSIAEGDEGAEEHSFAADVEEITRTWNAGHTLVVHDPQNEAVCFFHSADALNVDGYWTTKIILLGLRQGAFIGEVILSSSTQDMIVSGVATVNGKLEFLAGGRTLGGAVTVGTYRFGTGAGASVPYYAAWSYQDDGLETEDKCIESFSFTGKVTSATSTVHGGSAEEEVSASDLETGDNSKSGHITLDNHTSVKRSKRYQINVPFLRQYAPRIGGTWSGSGNKDRVDELVLEGFAGGARR